MPVKPCFAKVGGVSFDVTRVISVQGRSERDGSRIVLLLSPAEAKVEILYAEATVDDVHDAIADAMRGY